MEFEILINYFFYFLFFTFIYIDNMGRTQKHRNVVEVGNIQLGFLSEKIDNFQNELVYFAVTDKDWKTKLRLIQAIAEGNKALKVPYFMGDQGHPILRVKKKIHRLR